MNDVDVLVVGAGALGLACAARLAEAGHGVLVAERERLGRRGGTGDAGVVQLQAQPGEQAPADVALQVQL